MISTGQVESRRTVPPDRQQTFGVTQLFSSEEERQIRDELFALFEKTPIPDRELFSNMGLFLSRHQLARILFMDSLYRQIINVHGVVMEFGVRWGQNLGLFAAFRSMYEPFNLTRRIVGFDTFSGFSRVDIKDGNAVDAAVGGYGVADDYALHLENILLCHERLNPYPHVKKFDLVAGDAVETVERYFAEHPETVVALAYFDFDLYEPTRRCLEVIQPHLTRGSILGFDELCSSVFPGETRALKEVLGTVRITLQRTPLSQQQSYIVWD